MDKEEKLRVVGVTRFHNREELRKASEVTKATTVGNKATGSLTCCNVH